VLSVNMGKVQTPNYIFGVA